MTKLRDNLILKTDSYKLTHPRMTPRGTTRGHAHLMGRKGGDYDTMCWNGLQPILKRYLEGSVVIREDIEEAKDLAKWHFNGGVTLEEQGLAKDHQHARRDAPVAH